MQKTKRILLAVGCAVLLAVSWFVAVTAKSNTQIQAELLEQANTYLSDEIYIRSVPLLEQAASYKGGLTDQAETLLKDAYLKLIDETGYPRKYTSLLDKQMSRKDAPAEVFFEAANYYMERGKWADALSVLRRGVERTGSTELTELYEANRYRYKLGRGVYADVTEIYNGALQVFDGEHWGLADDSGELRIPCEYDMISTYSGDQVIVRKNGVVSAVDLKNHRLALLHDQVTEFTNFGQSRAWLKLNDGWALTNTEFEIGSSRVEDAGMYSNGLAAVKKNGKWGLTDISASSWFLEPQYDDVIRDELGRAFFQRSVFVRIGDRVTRLTLDEKGKQFIETGESYEDAKPFADGWAAVKQNGLWGFIDADGTTQIDFRYQDAKSFGQHLAAVEQDGRWGYISLRGEMVIEPEYIEAKSFNAGHAPVRDENGWRIITLIEDLEG